MKDNTRNSLMAASIAVVISVVMEVIFTMGVGGTALFALVMGAVAFAGTLAISTVMEHRAHHV